MYQAYVRRNSYVESYEIDSNRCSKLSPVDGWVTKHILGYNGDCIKNEIEDDNESLRLQSLLLPWVCRLD
jgi:hypothetical protein